MAAFPPEDVEPDVAQDLDFFNLDENGLANGIWTLTKFS